MCGVGLAELSEEERSLLTRLPPNPLDAIISALGVADGGSEALSVLLSLSQLQLSASCLCVCARTRAIRACHKRVKARRGTCKGVYLVGSTFKHVCIHARIYAGGGVDGAQGRTRKQEQRTRSVPEWPVEGGDHHGWYATPSYRRLGLYRQKADVSQPCGSRR